MDVEYLLEYLDYAVDTGITLSTEQQVYIQSSLRVLQDQARFNGMYFWGIIKGLSKDYHVAFGVREDALDRIFYYSLDGINWVLLPDPLSQDNASTLTLDARTRFVGDPMLFKPVGDMQEGPGSVITIGAGDMNRVSGIAKKDVTQIPEAKSYESQEIFEPSSRDLKEEDRLAVVVKLITEEAFTLPRRAMFKVPNKIGSVVFNKFFRGLNDSEASRLQNFVHYREPRNKWNINLLESSAANYSTDFLDTVYEDIPKNRSFCLTHSYDGMLVLSKSLLWHGSVSFHVLNTERYGNIYFGHGLKNYDLPFMMSPMIL